jgi:ubiquinone/menaquinone biosynthesis C-methylase UbiE
MEINYQETPDDLLTRIDIHNKFGGRNIDEWMLSVLSFLNALDGDADITGGDVNEALLDQARKENEKIGSPVKIVPLNFNERFPFEDNTFDLASCCFAIYYAKDIPFTIREMHRVLKPGGVLFSTGPMPANKQTFYDVIRAATGKEIPPMPGSSRYESQILASMRDTFSAVDVKVFENPLTFESAEPFLSYTRASLSEDRKLWNTFFQSKEEFEEIMQKITAEAERRVERDGELVMTKVVGGFIATK